MFKRFMIGSASGGLGTGGAVPALEVGLFFIRILFIC
jgi:hypothetical protein